MTEEIMAALKRLEDEEGRLTPEQVVQAAKDASSPLHPHFEWSNERAGHAYRLDQARQLIRSVRVQITGSVREVHIRRETAPAYLRDPDRPGTESGYRATESVKLDPDAARDVVITEFCRAAAALRRARQVARVLGRADEVDRLVEQVAEVGRSFHADPPPA